ncbi:MAG: OsmC family peroxiredoxin [Saprospiraceae bacterium]|nr:OsmC family peroxiredoxin [Saprospiraceae bacterium]
MAITRKASAHWEGNGKTGKGTLSTPSGVLHEANYSSNARFENAIGTNPEELIGAAHAGCFSMKLAYNFQAENLTPESIDTQATVVLDEGTITEVHLHTSVKITGIDQVKFNALLDHAKDNCPVSKLLKAKIILTSELIS